jgi:hypothetical protein
LFTDRIELVGERFAQGGCGVRFSLAFGRLAIVTECISVTLLVSPLCREIIYV